MQQKNNPVEVPVANEKLFNVSFDVSGFTSDVTPLPSLKTSAVKQTLTQAAVGLSDQITKLEYLVYNSGGQLLKDSVQTSGWANFGKIYLQLPAGSYKLVVAGMSGPYSIYAKENSQNVYLSYFTNGIGDWFKQVSDFTVTNQTLNQSVVLDRVVGKVGFILTDAIPKDLAKISLGFTSGSQVWLNNSANPTPEVQTVERPLKLSQEGELNFSSSAFVIPMSNGSITTDVSIRAYNTSGTLMVEKIIKNVVIEKNKMTTLTGALFTSLPTSTATDITINGDWKPSTIVTF